jgi:LPS-assembly protein
MNSGGKWGLVMSRDAGRRPSVFLFIAAVAFLLCVGGPSDSAAQGLKQRIQDDKEAQWQITANRLTYNEKEGLYFAEGDVVVTRSGQVLYAREGVYNEKTGLVEVSGDVRFESNGDYLTGERAVFDLNTRMGQMGKARLFMSKNHFYVNGDSMEKLGPDTYLVKDARLTSCDEPDSAWSITASEVKVTVEGYGVVKDGVFRIRGVPVLYVPWGIFPAKTQRQSGLLVPGLGYSSRNGAEVELPIYWAASDQTDATFYEHYMSKRGLMQGVEGRYVAEENSKGAVLFDILSDRIGEKNLGNSEEADISPFPRTNETRYWLRGKVDQAMPLGVTARLDTDYVSDQDYLREFNSGLRGVGYKGRPELAQQFGRPLEEVYSPFRTSRLRLSRDQSDYSLQARSSYYQRPQNTSDDTTPQPLGGAMYSVLPRPLFGAPFFMRFRSEYDTIYRDTGDKGQRVLVGPEISRPFWLGPYVEFEPSVGYTRATQFFEKGDGSSDEQFRDAYDLQGRVSTLLERTYDFEWEETKRLKHKVFPSLTYRYRGYQDGTKYRPWFESVDAEGKRNVVALSLENFVDARNEDAKGNVTYKQWGTFQLIQGYDIEGTNRMQVPYTQLEALTLPSTTRGDRHYEPLIGILTYHPFSSIDLDSEIRWDHYDEEVALADTFLEFNVKRAGGRADRYGLEYLYVRDRNESLGVNAHVNLTEKFAVGTSFHRSLDLGESVGARHYVQYSSQCWGVKLSVENLAGIDSVMVSFNLLGLGEFGTSGW